MIRVSVVNAIHLSLAMMANHLNLYRDLLAYMVELALRFLLSSTK